MGHEEREPWAWLMTHTLVPIVQQRSVTCPILTWQSDLGLDGAKPLTSFLEVLRIVVPSKPEGAWEPD